MTSDHGEYRHRTVDGQKLHPETLMMGYGYDPLLSEGALKCPIFHTSTFVFEKAEDGKSFFELAYGLRQPKPSEESGLIYSRINNPDIAAAAQARRGPRDLFAHEIRRRPQRPDRRSMPRRRGCDRTGARDAHHPRHHVGPGSTFAFEIDGGEAEAFPVLNALEVAKLAVSLGGTETLASHPASMTHADVPADDQMRMGITGGLIRISIGIEHPEDIIADLRQALAT